MFHPGDKIGAYTLCRPLGRGGYGEVWLAEKLTALETLTFAIKLLVDNSNIDAVKKEVAAWKLASGHPNVLSLVDADICDGQMILVSEYAADGSLAKWLGLRGGRAPSLSSAVEMTMGILQGLAHLHNRRVIHRDLKPDNILLQGDIPRLADFGLSRVLKSTSNSKSLAGTLDYMAPETLDGIRSEQGDIWAAGVILYLLITGNLPFKRDSRSALVKAIISDDPAPINVVLSSLLIDVVATSLRKDPDERFESATTMLNALAKCREYQHPAQEPEGGNLSQHEKSIAIVAHDVDTLRYSQDAPDPITDVVSVAQRPSNGDGLLHVKLDGVVMEFIRISAGTFQMGSPNGYDDEQPPHKVIISKPFYLSRFPVTQAQYQAVMDSNPSYFRDGDLDRPVEQVTWDDAQQFITTLNTLHTAHSYRLPTEAEWEFAALAGSAEVIDLDKMAWYDQNSNGTSHPVGTKSPNGWGLYDMQGNVWEWCQDWYDKYYYSNSPVRDPKGPSGGRSRVLRGGSWYCYDNFCRVANRGKYDPDGVVNSHGFRVVMTF